MIYTNKIRQAIRFAIKTHEVYQKQTRKGKGIAYITHPLTAGIILASAGASENVVVAGILHDTIEDSIIEKKVTEAMIEERFGTDVARLVSSVTEHDKTLSWDVRKHEALEDISHFSHEALLVKSADIVSNVSESIDDYAKHGDEVFSRFNAPKEKIVKHQLAIIAAILECWKENPLSEDLSLLAQGLKNIE